MSDTNTDEDQQPRDRAARLEAKAARLREREEAKRAEPPHQATPWVIVSAVLGALLVASIVVGLLVSLDLRHQRDSRTRALNASRALDAERATVLHLASQYAVDFGSYNYKTYDADVARVKAHLTGKTLSDYTQASQALRPTILQYQSVETAAVAAAAIQTITPSQVTVIVLLDQTVTSKQSPTPRIDRNRLSMVLQRQPNGTWVVPQVTNV
jgi:Mce-associated membrane protein